MAVYVFKCRSCAKVFELSMLMSKFADTIKKTGTIKCPECGKKADLSPNAAAVHYKGTGWYVTDYTNIKDKPKKKDKA